MGFIEWLRGKTSPEEADENVAIARADEASISVVERHELEAIAGDGVRRVSKPVSGQLAGFADALVPVMAAGADAAAQYGMAVVKFPEGVGWGDLCVRKSDGWNLLSSFKDGKFNDMAGIKQAALQPTAVANLAMQGAAVAVGAAYMAQISDQLKGIESGIEAIKRELQLERDAKLLSSFDMLQRYSARYQEYLSSPEKKQAALVGIEQSLRDAREIWRFQLDSMRDLNKEIASSRKPKRDQILEYSARLREMEQRSSVAFQLCAAVGQLSMRYDEDFSPKRIEDERNDLRLLQEEYNEVRGAAHASLSRKALSIGGSPLALAEAAERRYDGDNPLLNVAHGAGSNLARVNPVRMRSKAKDNIRTRRARLADEISFDNQVRIAATSQLDTLDEMDFMYNQADTMILNGDDVLFLGPTDDEGTE